MTSKQLLELAPDQIAKLPSREIPLLVQTAIQLDREIKDATVTLGLYKFRLIEEAEAEAHKAEIKELRGTTWNFPSPAGEIAQIVFPEDALIKSGFFFQKGQALRFKEKLLIKMGDIKALAGAHFEVLFQTTYKPAKAFRELAAALLPGPNGRTLIAALEEPSSPRVNFKTAE